MKFSKLISDFPTNLIIMKNKPPNLNLGDSFGK